MVDREKIAHEVKLKIDELNNQIDLLELNVEQAADDVKQSYQDQLNAVKAKRDLANEKLEEMKTNAELSLDDLRFGLEQAYDSLKIAVEDAVERFK